MADPKVFNLLAGFTHQQSGRVGGRSKAVVDVKVSDPNFAINVDEKDISRQFADAIKAIIQANVDAGLGPDGTPLPTVSPATVERREYRDRQAARGGKRIRKVYGPLTAQQQNLDNLAVKNFKRRFKAPRVGKFDPTDHPNDKFGVESGLLFKSIAVTAFQNGWRIFFANVRGIVDAKGNSAAGRVFSRIPLWSQKANEQPAMKAATRNLANGLIMKRGVNSAKRLLRELVKTGQELKELGDELADE